MSDPVTPKKKGVKREFSDAEYHMMRVLLACGTPAEKVAEALQVSLRTLQRNKRYQGFMASAKLEVKALAVGGLIHAIRERQAWAICFYLKTQFPDDFSEKLKIDQNTEITQKGAISEEPMSEAEWFARFGASRN